MLKMNPTNLTGFVGLDENGDTGTAGEVERFTVVFEKDLVSVNKIFYGLALVSEVQFLVVQHLSSELPQLTFRQFVPAGSQCHVTDKPPGNEVIKCKRIEVPAQVIALTTRHDEVFRLPDTTIGSRYDMVTSHLVSWWGTDANADCDHCMFTIRAPMILCAGE